MRSVNYEAFDFHFLLQSERQTMLSVIDIQSAVQPVQNGRLGLSRRQLFLCFAAGVNVRLRKHVRAETPVQSAPVLAEHIIAGGNILSFCYFVDHIEMGRLCHRHVEESIFVLKPVKAQKNLLRSDFFAPRKKLGKQVGADLVI